jgi:carbon monoxide dehydrogenase subunit G
MLMKGEVLIRADRQTVWDALNDPKVLRQCIPGCESLEKSADNTMTAKVTNKIGPVKATFSGKVTLSDLDPPNSYVISGEGSGGVAGFAKGSASVTLVSADTGTSLSYDVNSAVGGKIAQIGARLVETTARKLADEFFTKFASIVEVNIGRSERSKSETNQLAEPTTEESAGALETPSRAPNGTGGSSQCRLLVAAGFGILALFLALFYFT